MTKDKLKQATRPVFLPNAKAPCYFYQKEVTFNWVYDAKHKKIDYHKNSINLRQKFHDEYNLNLLEVSSASDCSLGKNLTPSKLTITTKNHRVYTVEQLFQAGKVFDKAGSQIGLLKTESQKAKRVAHKIQKDGDQLIGFYLFGKEFPIKPVNLYFDWLYLHALDMSELSQYCLGYDGFTDIWFDSTKSVNCSAIACAKYKSLCENHKLDEALNDINKFRKLLEE